MMNLNLTAVRNENPGVAKIDYTASIIITPSHHNSPLNHIMNQNHIQIMHPSIHPIHNPTINQSHNGQTPNPIINFVLNPISGPAYVAGVAFGLGAGDSATESSAISNTSNPISDVVPDPIAGVVLGAEVFAVNVPGLDCEDSGFNNHIFCNPSFIGFANGAGFYSFPDVQGVNFYSMDEAAGSGWGFIQGNRTPSTNTIQSEKCIDIESASLMNEDRTRNQSTNFVSDPSAGLVHDADAAANDSDDAEAANFRKHTTATNSLAGMDYYTSRALNPASGARSIRIDSRARCEPPDGVVEAGAGCTIAGTASTPVPINTSELSVYSANKTTTTAASENLIVINRPAVISTTRNNILPAPDVIRDFSSLNRMDLDEVFDNQHLLSAWQLNLLRTVQKKQQYHPLRYRDDYLQHSSIMLLSSGWSSAQRYSLCSIPNRANRSGQCRLHKYCPYCCFLERQKALARYVPAYHRGNWFFLTGSLAGDLPMTGTSSYHELTAYWDAYKSAIRQLLKDSLIRGAFWTEELAVNRLSPVHALPHIHATMEADDLSDETLMRLAELVAGNLKSSLGPDHLLPNLQLKNLDGQRKLLSHLQYQLKPIRITRAYDWAWTQCQQNNRSGVVKLNSDTTDLVLGYSTATKDRLKINCCGSLNPKAKAYIGTGTKDLKDMRGVVAEVMKDGVDFVEPEGECETATS